MTQKVKKAVIPAAGLGTRFLPATKEIPKEMIPIVDIPMIQLIVEEAVKSGIEDVIIVTSRQKEAIENHFDHQYEIEDTLRKKGKKELLGVTVATSTLCNLITVRQKTPLGLGHAVLTAKSDNPDVNVNITQASSPSEEAIVEFDYKGKVKTYHVAFK